MSKSLRYRLTVLAENTLKAVLQRLESSATGESWDQLNFNDILHEENVRLGLKSKVFMTVLRHALTGMKVCLIHLSLLVADEMFPSQRGPGVPETMRALGSQRTLARLRTAHSATVII